MLNEGRAVRSRFTCLYRLIGFVGFVRLGLFFREFFLVEVERESSNTVIKIIM